MKKNIQTKKGNLIIEFIGKMHSIMLTIENDDNESFIILENDSVNELINFITPDDYCTNDIFSIKTSSNIEMSENHKIKKKGNSLVIGPSNVKGEKKYYISILGDQESDVFIGLPQANINLLTIENIQNACGDFMEALGFELKNQEEPVYGSFYQRLKFKLRQPKSQEELDDLYTKGKLALETKYLNLPSAEATEKLAVAASKIIESLANIDEASIRLGSIIIIKIQKENKTIILSETVTPALSSVLDNMPNIFSNPRAVYELLEVNKIKGDVFKSEENINIVE